MTVIEMSMAMIAIASVVMGVTAVLVAVRLQPIAENTERILETMRDLLIRLERIADDAETMVRDTSRVQRRLTRSADRILDQVEPPLRIIPALMTGVRAGIAALFRGAPHREPVAPPRTPPTPQP